MLCFGYLDIPCSWKKILGSRQSRRGLEITSLVNGLKYANYPYTLMTFLPTVIGITAAAWGTLMILLIFLTLPWFRRCLKRNKIFSQKYTGYFHCTHYTTKDITISSKRQSPREWNGLFEHVKKEKLVWTRYKRNFWRKYTHYFSIKTCFLCYRHQAVKPVSAP